MFLKKEIVETLSQFNFDNEKRPLFVSLDLPGKTSAFICVNLRSKARATSPNAP
jgi:hypothetical protein